MSDFKDSLNEEIEKRRDSDDNDAIPKPKEKTSVKTKRTKVFSFMAFVSGLTICSLFTLGLVGWAWFKSDQTHKAVLEKLPSKTAIIKTINDSGGTQKAQTTLTIPKIEGVVDLTQPKVTKTELQEKAPIISSEKPYKANQASFTKKTDKPLLSFVITDLGLSSKKTTNIIRNFPKGISFSFSPYANNLAPLADDARNDGHETWLSLPLETKEYPLNDPGPSTLLINASTEKNSTRVQNLLNNAQGYVGFISQQNHAFKTEDANVNPVIKEIFDRGFAIIDGNMSLRSFIDSIADKNDYPYTKNDLWLDNDLAPLSINQNIRKIIMYGEQKKNVIVMLRPYPISLKAVQKFLNSKDAEIFEIAPVSAQLKNN